MIRALTKLHRTVENLLYALDLAKPFPNRKHCLVLDFFSVPIFFT